MAVAEVVSATVREDALDYLTRKQPQEFRKGQTIYTQEDAPSGLYLVITGRVATIMGRGNGSEAIVRISGPQQLFGEITHERKDLIRRAVALDRVHVMHWNAAEVARLLERSPRLAIALMQEWLMHCRGLQDRLSAMSQLQTGDRVALALYQLAKRLGSELPDGSLRMPPITHQALADYVGTSREIVTCEMNALRRLGMVQYTRTSIEVYAAALRDHLQRRWAGRDMAEAGVSTAGS